MPQIPTEQIPTELTLTGQTSTAQNTVPQATAAEGGADRSEAASAVTSPPEPAVMPSDWARMVLPTAILATVADGPLHGYGIAQALGLRGLGTPRGGSLYPVLGRLERDGQLTAAWHEGNSGPGRKEYTITDRGRERLAADHDAWQRVGLALWGSAGNPDAGHGEESR